MINNNLEEQMCLIYEDMVSKALSGQIKYKNIMVKDICNIITGKEDANFSVENGLYNFFTCSNDTLKCDDYAFDSSSILIAGNGDFNVKHYTGRFNAYQRTYVLTPPYQYYGILYLASLYQIKAFKSNSNGSIVKFITKGDIENIPIFVPENKEILSALNNLIKLKEQNIKENEKLIVLRNFLLPILMNGQATIEE